MSLRNHGFFALLLTALGLVMGGAHLLELPVRMHYDPAFYMQVTSTLYRYFGLVGGPLQVLALLVCATLVWRVRSRTAFNATLTATLCLALSLLLWFTLVQPVNAAWLDALHAGRSEAVHAYAQLRTRWEYGHVAAFVAWLGGFVMLLHSMLQEAANASAMAPD